MLLTSTLQISPSEFEARTGWAAKPEGLCRGEVCVPAPDVRSAAGLLDASRVADRLRMPLVRDDEHGVAALGPSTLGGHALDTAVAADPVLIDRAGSDFRLSSLRGRKVLLVAWASY